MAWNRNRGAIVDLEARRAARARKALEDANRGMLQAEEALFQLLRGVDRSERKRQEEPAAKPARLDQTHELPALGAEPAAPSRTPREPGRVLPFRRVRAA